MTFRSAIALLALAVPAVAQHGGAHGGSFGSRGSGIRSFGGGGFAGRAGFSGSPRFSEPGSFVRPGQLVGYGAMGSAGFRGMGLSGFRTPYNGNRFMAGRSAFGSMDAGRSRAWGRNGDEDRDRFDRRRRSFINWYLNTYSPNWLGYGYGYPYTINPGFFDWGDTDDSGYDQGGEYDQGGAAPAYPPPYPDEGSPYPDEGYAAPNEQPVAAAPAAPEPDQTLLLILKSGGAPVKVQNYMMTAKVLTVLDPQHYQQIPLDQIDLAATRRVNSAAGVEFQVPDASRE